MIEIVACYAGRRGYKADLDEVEVNKVQDKEDENNDPCMEHVL